jgi:hypothetical protein
MLAPAAPLSPRELEEQIAQLQSALGRLGTAGADLAALAEVAERFGVLRRQYLSQRERLNGYVPRLTQLRERLDALLGAQVPRVVDHYHEIGERLRRAEAERDFLREFFIRRAGGAGLELAGERAEMTIKVQPGIAVPAAGSENRTKLERVLHESGHWAEVSQLARARLLRAMEAKRFTGPQEQEIARLCPRTLTHQVIARPRLRT